MLLELITWIKENVAKYLGQPSTESHPQDKPDSSYLTTLLQLDHMRNKPKYIKTLKRWAADLNILGALIFKESRIYVLLHSAEASVKVSMFKLLPIAWHYKPVGQSLKSKLRWS